MNTVIVMGQITRDIELRYLADGKGVANFSIAYNKKYKGQDGQLVEKVSFFDVSVFGKNAETINQHFRKGSRILVHGELEQSSWKTQAGENRSKITIKLVTFDFIDRKEQGQQQDRGYHNPNPTNERAEPQQTSYRQPRPQAPAVDVNEDDIPFAPIGMSEGGYYVHLI